MDRRVGFIENLLSRIYREPVFENDMVFMMYISLGRKPTRMIWFFIFYDES